MNTISCGMCKFYDPIVGVKRTTNTHGWCTKRSLYPAKEGPGQVFPEDCKRAAEGQYPKPCIVRFSTCLTHCTQAERKNK